MDKDKLVEALALFGIVFFCAGGFFVFDRVFRRHPLIAALLWIAALLAAARLAEYASQFPLPLEG